MAWIESHDDIWDHHKTVKFCQAIGRPDYAAVGHLTSLWHFVLRNAWRDANLEPWGDVGIERAARWDGEPGRLVNALRECGLLDGYIVHGWLERAGKLVNDRLYNEARKINAVKRRKNATFRRKTEATLPYPTLPNPTLPNRTVQQTDRRFAPPTLQQVADYCKQRGKGIDPQKWFDYYQANGWKVGRNPMRDWQAAIRTWEKNQFLALPKPSIITQDNTRAAMETRTKAYIADRKAMEARLDG